MTHPDWQELETASKQALHWLGDAIDSEGCTDDELLERDGTLWVRLICARNVLSEALTWWPAS